MLLARDGKLEQAVENQALGFMIARHAESDPCLIAYLVGLACCSISFSGLSAILDGASRNAAAARKAAQFLNYSVGALGRFVGGQPETREADRKAGEAFFRYAMPAAK